MGGEKPNSAQRYIGAGIYCESPAMEISIRLPDYGSVFQAEVFAIGEACRQLLCQEIQGRHISIFSDSQAAIMALESEYSKSKIVIDSKEALNLLGIASDATLAWVPGHRNIDGNETADELARKGSGLDVNMAIRVNMPMKEAFNLIESYFYDKADKFWRELITCKRARCMWPQYDRRRTEVLISHNRRNISRLTEVLTGHWAVGKHAARMGIRYNRYCRSCDDETEEETIEHFLLNCPALSGLRLRTLGKPFFHNLKEIGNLDISSILTYIIKSNWF